MKTFFYALALIYGAFIVLLLARYFWMRAQARHAIRADLQRRHMNDGRLREAKVWKDCGSISAAFWSLKLDYEVHYRQDDQPEESWLMYEVDFIPVIGRLRELNLLSASDPELSEDT